MYRCSAGSPLSLPSSSCAWVRSDLQDQVYTSNPLVAPSSSLSHGVHIRPFGVHAIEGGDTDRGMREIAHQLCQDVALLGRRDPVVTQQQLRLGQERHPGPVIELDPLGGALRQAERAVAR